MLTKRHCPEWFPAILHLLPVAGISVLIALLAGMLLCLTVPGGTAMATRAQFATPHIPAATPGLPGVASHLLTTTLSTGEHSSSLRRVANQQQPHQIYLPLIRVAPNIAPFSLVVTATPDAISANGVSTSTITAQVRGTAVKSPPDYTITFETTQGTFSNGNRIILVATDATGVARATLTSLERTRDVQATVTARVIGTDNQEFTDSIPVLFQSLAPAPATVLVTTRPGRIPADQETTAEVLAVVRSESNGPVASHVVTFSTTLGRFSNGETSISSITNAEGEARVELVSPAWENESVRATVTTQATTRDGEPLIDTTGIWFDSPEPAPLQLHLTASLDRIPVNADRTVSLSATVRTNEGIPIPDHLVTFKTSQGMFANGQTSIQHTTDISGTAEARLDIEWLETDLQAMVQASVVTRTVEGEQRTRYDEVNIWFEPPQPKTFQLVLSAESGRIPANGTSQAPLIATLTGVAGEPLANYPVTFETTHGIFSSGGVSTVHLTDADGQARATLQSAFSTTPIEASVTARVTTDTGEDVDDTTSVWFTVPSLVYVSAVPQRLPATVSSMAAIIATVLDDTGTPLANYAVDFSTTLGTFEGGMSVTRIKSNADGEAIANLYGTPTLNTAQVTVQVGQGQVSNQTTVEFVASEQQDVEPNNVPAEAGLLEHGVYRGSFQDEMEGEDDYYLVYLDIGQAIHLELTDIPIGADYDMVLYDATLAYVAYSNEYGNVNEYIDYVKKTGTLEPYYIRVNMRTKAAQAQNTYLLTFSPGGAVGGATTVLPSLDVFPTFGPEAEVDMPGDPPLPPKPGR